MVDEVFDGRDIILQMRGSALVSSLGKKTGQWGVVEV